MIKTIKYILNTLDILLTKVTGLEKEIVYLEGIIKGTNTSS